MKDIDAICTKIYTDIDAMISRFLLTTNNEQNRRLLKLEITHYFQTALSEGVVYHMPEVTLEYPGPNVVNVVLRDQDTGYKIEALDEIVTPLAKYSNSDDGGILGF